MKRLLLIIKTEILTTRSSLQFHIIALLSPILFFVAFAGQLESDVSFPINFKTTETPFYESIDSYTSPAGTPYYEIDNEQNLISITELKQIEVIDDKFSGVLKQKIGSIDKNITKNYRNRLTGAVSNYFSTEFPEKAIQITETRLYKEDPSWSSFFASTILIFGILLSGFLFGAFSYTREWETNSVYLFKLSPINPIYILSGKFLGALIKSIITVILYTIFITLKLKTLIFISYEMIGIILLIYSTAIIIGMLIGLSFKKTLVAFIIGLVSSILFWALGGGLGTRAGMTRVIQAIINMNPISKYINLILHNCFNGPISLIDIVYPVSVLLAAVFVFSIKYYRDIYKPKFTSSMISG